MTPADPARRRLLAHGGAVGLGLIAARIGGVEAWLSPAEAATSGAATRVLTPGEAATLGAFAETLVPGARAAGVVPFVDHHLGVAAADCLLMLRYFDVPPPYAGFYKAGLAALDGAARARFGRGFAALDAGQAAALTATLIAPPGAPPPAPPGWAGPPAMLVYLAVRADAADVVWGTEAGFAALGVPYQAHIAPEGLWPA